MLLHRLIDAVSAHLVSVLPGGIAVSTLMPKVVAELPVVVLSVAAAEPLGAGIGGQPRGMVSGALPLNAAIDLADPVLRFADGESVELLAPDRLTLQLPHSPLVDADGGDIGPLAPGAVTLQRGAQVFTLVDGAPAAGQVQVDRETGSATFGAPLPGTGVLQAAYFVGRWEAASARFLATLQADVFAASAPALDALSRQLAEAMARQRVAGLSQVSPLDWGAMAAPGVPAGNTLRRVLSWRCRFEYDDPQVLTGGGPIRGVAVTLTPRPGAEPTVFTVAQP